MSEIALAAEVLDRRLTFFSAETVDELPTGQTDEHRGMRLDPAGVIYVLAFDNGEIKAGQSRFPRKRLLGHQQDARRWLSAEVANGWVSAFHSNFVDNERALLRYCASVGELVRGAETFRGVSLQLLTAEAKRLRFITPLQGPVESGKRIFEVVQGGLQAGSAPTTGSAFALPPAELEAGGTPEELAALRERLAAAMDMSIQDVERLSWFDLYVMKRRAQLRADAAEAEAEIAELRLQILTEGRVDLMAPWVRADSEPVEAGLS